jgi:hypothetical protein
MWMTQIMTRRSSLPAKAGNPVSVPSMIDSLEVEVLYPA